MMPMSASQYGRNRDAFALFIDAEAEGKLEVEPNSSLMISGAKLYPL
jgi:hypothetical protein